MVKIFNFSVVKFLKKCIFVFVKFYLNKNEKIYTFNTI